MENKTYAIAILASKTVDCKNNAVIQAYNIKARSSYEARGYGYEIAYKTFPSEKGWINHIVSVAPETIATIFNVHEETRF